MPDHRSQYGRKINLYSSSRPDYAYGSGWIGGARQKLPAWVGGPDLFEVGAGDELARGNSTFMVEMNGTANILNRAHRPV